MLLDKQDTICEKGASYMNENNTNNSRMLAPAVFVVNKTYHIMMYVQSPSLMWVKIGDKTYYDAVNGILRSNTVVHKVIVPMEVLDKAKSYTVCVRNIIDRKPYFPEIEPVQEHTYEFRPVKRDGNVRAYHIADAHNWAEGPIAAAKTYGAIDFLILNGDIPDHSGTVENCITIYELASAITSGNIPIVFARGNHDMRGLFAEKFGEHTPTDNGKSYYTFRLGNIWGMILDCGEDKVDEHEEYGGTICCHQFREDETEFIKDVIFRADREYLEEEITHKLIICHNPFTFKYRDPFDIEHDTYQEWTKLLNEYIRPDAIICGHVHRLEIVRKGDEKDLHGALCPVVTGAAVKKTNQELYAGAGFEFTKEGVIVTFTNHLGDVIREERL